MFRDPYSVANGEMGITIKLSIIVVPSLSSLQHVSLEFTIDVFFVYAFQRRAVHEMRDLLSLLMVPYSFLVGGRGVVSVRSSGTLKWHLTP